MSKPFSRRKPLAGRRMHGMSLVELMIAITIGLVILAGMVGIFSTTSSARNEVERTSRQIENGRYAMEVLSDELRLAGFNGELNVGSLAAPASLPDPCSVTASDWADALPLHLQGHDEGTGAPSCIGGTIKADTDVITVRRVRACTAGTSGCAAAANGSPYLQVSQCETESATTPYVLGVHGTATYSLTRKDCSTTAPLREYLVRMYFISTDNGAGQSIPTLKRRDMTGAATVEVPLVEGIEHMQFVYGIDHTGDGLPDAYTADPASYTYAGCTGCTAVNNWMNVMTVQVYLLARNIETSPGHTDTKTYTLGTNAAGNAVTLGPFNDAYRRHVYASVVRVANPAGRRDTP